MSLYYQDDQVTLYHGDSRTVAASLPSLSVDCIVTSPPYFGLRDYGIEGQYGLEESPAAYVETMRSLFEELRRVLAHDGTLWLNIGDSYNAPKTRRPQTNTTTCLGTVVRTQRGQTPSDTRSNTAFSPTSEMEPKNLLGIPWRVAFALQDDGWILRNAVVWHKPNGMPESVTDRLSTRYEHVFLFSKNQRYWFDLDAIREPHIKPPGSNRGDHTKASIGAMSVGHKSHTGLETDGHLNGRNPGDVWSINTQAFTEAHFAVMPVTLAERCVQSGCKPGGIVLDPFSGSGTTGLAAARHGRKYVGIDLNADYLKMSLDTRLGQAALNFGEAV